MPQGEHGNASNGNNTSGSDNDASGDAKRTGAPAAAAAAAAAAATAAAATAAVTTATTVTSDAPTTTAGDDAGSSTSTSSSWSEVRASERSLATHNPIRAIVDNLKVPPAPDKAMIALSIGDPTVFGNLLPPANVRAAFAESLETNRFNGYPHSAGYPDARRCVADFLTRDGALSAEHALVGDDVFITSGCSHAVEIALHATCDAGRSNIVVPTPGFPLYEVVCVNKGFGVRQYRLDPTRDWQVDMASLAAAVDEHTAAIVVCNPSNPCGSVFSREHVVELVEFAAARRLPIIADEIYAGMVFPGESSTTFAAVSDEVPIISLGGIAKRFLVPGWRLGWIALNDRRGRLARVREAVLKQTTVILGASSIVQSVLPNLLVDTPASYHTELMTTLHAQAMLCVDGLRDAPGLAPLRPRGTMYLMVEVRPDEFDDAITDDVTFARLLISEQSVFVLPGQCFYLPNFFRIVYCAPAHVLADAVQRIREFCRAHAKNKAE